MDNAQTSSQLSSVRSELGAVSSATLAELRKLVTTGHGASEELGFSIEQCERNDVGSARSRVGQLETELTRQEEQFNKVLSKSQKTIEKAAAAGTLQAANRVQKAAMDVQDAISEYKDVIANGIEKVRKAIEEAIGPVIEKVKLFFENLIRHLKDLWERAKQSFSEIQKQAERIFGDILLCVQTLVSNGMTVFQQGKLAFEAAKEVGQAIGNKEWEKAKQKAIEAKTAGESAYHAGEKCYVACQNLIKELPINVDALIDNIKTHIKAAQDAAAEALEATKNDAMAVCDQAKRSAGQLRTSVETELVQFCNKTKQTASRLGSILTAASTDLERQAVQDAQGLLQELEKSGQELLSVVQQAVQKLGAAAHESSISGKTKEELESKVQSSLAHHEDAQTKIREVLELEGKLWSLNWNGIGELGREMQQLASNLADSGRQIFNQLNSLVGEVKQAILNFKEETGDALRKRVEQWKEVASAAEASYDELKLSLETKISDLKEEAQKTITDAESGLEQLKTSFDQFVDAGSQAIDKLKNLDISGAMNVIDKGKDCFEKGKSLYEKMKSHYEKLKEQVLALKDAVERFIHQAEGVIKQAEQAVTDTVATAKHVGDTLRDQSQKLMESAGRKLEQAKKSMGAAQRSADSVARIARHAGEEVKQGCEAAGKAVAALGTAGTAALQSGFGVKSAAVAAAGTVDQEVRKGVLQLCEEAQKAVDGAKQAATQASEAAQQVASGNAGGAMSTAQRAEEKAVTARGEAQKAHDQGGAVAAEAKQAHADNTDLDAFRRKAAMKEKSAEGATGNSGQRDSSASDKPAVGSTDTEEARPAGVEPGAASAASAASPASPVSPVSPAPGGQTGVGEQSSTATASSGTQTPLLFSGLVSVVQKVQDTKLDKSIVDQLKDLAKGVASQEEPRPSARDSPSAAVESH